MTRIDVNTTFEPEPVTWVRVDGPLASPADLALVEDTVGLLPLSSTIVIDLDATTSFTATAAQGLGALAQQVCDHHGQLVILAGDLSYRTELVLAEVDDRATLLHTAVQVEQLLGRAA